MTGSAVAPAVTTCCAGASSSSSSRMTKPDSSVSSVAAAALGLGSPSSSVSSRVGVVGHLGDLGHDRDDVDLLELGLDDFVGLDRRRQRSRRPRPRRRGLLRRGLARRRLLRGRLRAGAAAAALATPAVVAAFLAAALRAGAALAAGAVAGAALSSTAGAGAAARLAGAFFVVEVVVLDAVFVAAAVVLRAVATVPPLVPERVLLVLVCGASTTISMSWASRVVSTGFICLRSRAASAWATGDLGAGDAPVRAPLHEELHDRLVLEHLRQGLGGSSGCCLRHGSSRLSSLCASCWARHIRACTITTNESGGSCQMCLAWWSRSLSDLAVRLVQSGTQTL